MENNEYLLKIEFELHALINSYRSQNSSLTQAKNKNYEKYANGLNETVEKHIFSKLYSLAQELQTQLIEEEIQSKKLENLMKSLKI